MTITSSVVVADEGGGSVVRRYSDCDSNITQGQPWSYPVPHTEWFMFRKRGWKTGVLAFAWIHFKMEKHTQTRPCALPLSFCWTLDSRPKNVTDMTTVASYMSNLFVVIRHCHRTFCILYLFTQYFDCVSKHIFSKYFIVENVPVVCVWHIQRGRAVWLDHIHCFCKHRQNSVQQTDLSYPKTIGEE